MHLRTFYSSKSEGWFVLIHSAALAAAASG
jgi:hypothetical protein